MLPDSERIGETGGAIQEIDNVFTADDEEVGQANCFPIASFGMRNQSPVEVKGDLKRR